MPWETPTAHCTPTGSSSGPTPRRLGTGHGRSLGRSARAGRPWHGPQVDPKSELFCIGNASNRIAGGLRGIVFGHSMYHHSPAIITHSLRSYPSIHLPTCLSDPISRLERPKHPTLLTRGAPPDPGRLRLGMGRCGHQGAWSWMTGGHGGSSK